MKIENAPACKGYGKAWDKDGTLCYLCNAECECEELTNKRDREQCQQNKVCNSINKEKSSLVSKYQELEEQNKKLSEIISNINDKETPKPLKKISTNIYECIRCERRYYYTNEFFALEDVNYCDNCGQRIDFNLSSEG